MECPKLRLSLSEELHLTLPFHVRSLRETRNEFLQLIHLCSFGFFIFNRRENLETFQIFKKLVKHDLMQNLRVRSLDRLMTLRENRIVIIVIRQRVPQREI